MNHMHTALLTLAAIAVVALGGGDGDEESRRGRSDDMLIGEMQAMLQTLVQRVDVLEAESAAQKNQLAIYQQNIDKLSTNAFFTAHLGHQATPAHGQTVLFDVIQADSADAYDVTQRAYVVPVTGVYWVHVVVDVGESSGRAALELYADSELLGTADGADVSEAVFAGAFSLQQDQHLLVKRAHDAYNSGNPLNVRTAFSVVLIRTV